MERGVRFGVCDPGPRLRARAPDPRADLPLEGRGGRSKRPGAGPAHRMIGILASAIDGVLVGAVYGLAAMGLTLIWGVMNVINLTHGAMIVLGMFAVYFLATAVGLSPYGGVPIVIVLGFLFGVVLYWVAVNRVVGRPVLMSLLATFAVNMVLIG